jgi:hypothetical protein
MTTRDLDDTRIANLRAALMATGRLIEQLSVAVANDLSPLGIAQELKRIGDMCEAALLADAIDGGMPAEKGGRTSW